MKTVLCIEDREWYMDEGINVKDLIIEEEVVDGTKYVTVTYTREREGH